MIDNEPEGDLREVFLHSIVMKVSPNLLIVAFKPHLHISLYESNTLQEKDYGFLYFTNLAGNLVLTSPHVGILHNLIICMCMGGGTFYISRIWQVTLFSLLLMWVFYIT